MTREQKIKYGLIAIVVLLAIALLIVVFRDKGRNDSSLMDKIEAKDEIIKIQSQTINFLEEAVKHSRGADSAYIRAIRDNQPKIIINEQRLQDIPTRYRDISKDDLRKRATTY